MAWKTRKNKSGQQHNNTQQHTTIVIEDKSTLEQMELIQQLDEEDKSTVFKIIDKMLTTKKFKDFFNKNVAAL